MYGTVRESYQIKLNIRRNISQLRAPMLTSYIIGTVQARYGRLSLTTLIVVQLPPQQCTKTQRSESHLKFLIV